MESSLLSISKIFSDRLFRIPDYQRGYSWSNKQLNDFWSDLEKLQEGKNHYTGVLTLESVSRNIYDRWDDDKWIIESKRYEPFFIVDGQQRMTTIIILIQTIIEYMKNDTKINYTEKKDIQRKFIFDSKNEGISRSYIFGYERDNPSYNFLKKEIFLENIDDNLEETIYAQNLKTAKDFFTAKISNISNSEVEKIYTKITQGFLFNIFTISNDIDVCIAFETMNNRGKPLSHLELLKNRLIYVSTQLNSNNTEKDKLRRNINSCWKSVYHNLGKNKNNPLSDDLFLMTHCEIYFYETLNGSDKLYRFSLGGEVESYSEFLLNNIFNQKNISPISLKKGSFRISLNSVNDYVQSMKDVVEIWYDILNPALSKYDDSIKISLIRLNHIGMERFFASVLVFMKYMENDEYISKVMSEMERVIFILSIIKYRYAVMSNNSVRKGFLDIAMELKNGKLKEEDISVKIRKISSDLSSNGDFSKSLPESLRWSGGFYNWDTVRYVLFEYEMYLKSQTRNSREKISWEEFKNPESDFISVEHIYPQQARNIYWTSRFGKYTQKQKEALRNSIGNLLPLSKSKNSSLSNKPFLDKARGDDGKYVSYQYGSYSEIEVSKEDEWTAQKIVERGMRIINFMEKRWDLNFGTDLQKKKILGVDFVK
ncbi:DUF262 domain-containing protein [Komagataeibacter sp. FXV3]|uniref:GmrSD restriction endonuclease domain-containing protein n=1 Tax=Komagataeibacter sp. FXV3 TaxID=2608998 RepID=UPI00187B7E5A|nr:DUF262 domain-containing protein [Komagataeibacter sp. FXV3]MBE7730585.1 DUF262 domain-containing protein [Komagataeibacter sp. FXV3]